MNLIKWEEWVNRFKPIKNHIDSNASMDGFMFETFGKEMEAVQLAQPECVWTLRESDGVEYIVSGHRQVDRVGYFITEKPYDPKTSGSDLFVEA
jgi:hypothetical protein